MPRTASHTVNYEDPQCAGGSLLLEDEGTLRLGRSTINIVRVFPGVPAKVDTSGQSSVTYEGKASIERRDLLSIGGGTRTGLSTPRRWRDPCYRGSGLIAPLWSGYTGLSSGSGVTISTLWAIDAKTGSSTVPGMHYDEDTNEIVADRDVYANLRAKYHAGCNRYAVHRSGDNAKAEVTVTAFFRGAFASLTLPGILGLDRIPVYYITSDYVADSEGSWEVPRNWPDDNTYPELPSADPLPDNSSYQQMHRVHEEATIDDLGGMRITERLRYNSNYLMPFDDAPLTPTPYGYDRVFTFRSQSAPDEQSIFRDAWDRIDFDDLFASATQRFPGLILV